MAPSSAQSKVGRPLPPRSQRWSRVSAVSRSARRGPARRTTLPDRHAADWQACAGRRGRPRPGRLRLHKCHPEVDGTQQAIASVANRRRARAPWSSGPDRTCPCTQPPSRRSAPQPAPRFSRRHGPESRFRRAGPVRGRPCAMCSRRTVGRGPSRAAPHRRTERPPIQPPDCIKPPASASRWTAIKASLRGESHGAAISLATWESGSARSAGQTSVPTAAPGRTTEADAGEKREAPAPVWGSHLAVALAADAPRRPAARSTGSANRWEATRQAH